MGYRDKPGAAPVLIIAFNGTVYGFEPKTGRQVWQQAIGESTIAVVFDGEDRIYASASSSLACIDYRTGRVHWSVTTRFTGRAALVVQDGLVFVGRAGEAECFTTDGKPLWHEPFTGKGYGAIAIGFPGNFVQGDANS